MKTLVATLCFVIVFFSISGSSRPESRAESIAPDFVIKDSEGVEHQLSVYLQQGKSVILNFSSTWCKPCWNYKQSGVLDDVWSAYGPDGSDDVVILFLEADNNTCEECLYGQEECNDFTYGDWTSSPYPTTNLEGSNRSILSIYNVTKFPSIYAISSRDNSVREMGQLSYIKWQRWLEKQQPESIAIKREMKAPAVLHKNDVSSVQLTSNNSSLLKIKSQQDHILNKASLPLELKIYPNPCFENIYIELSKEGLNAVDVTVYNSQGEMALRRNLQPDSRRISLDVSNLSGGAYFVVINTVEKVISKKILVLK